MSSQKAPARGGEGTENGKGKEKDLGHDGHDGQDQHNTTNQGETTKEQDGPSTLSRIAQSAVSLPSSLLSGPSGAELTIGGNGKGEASHAGQSLARAGESSVQIRPNFTTGGSIKPGHVQEHIAQEEASFAAFLDSDDVPMLSEPGRLEDAWKSTSTPVHPAEASPVSSTNRQPSQSVMDQMAADGADVVALLSTNDHSEPDFVTDDAISHGDLSNLRKALFGDGADGHGTSSGIPWDNVLNFIPEYLHPQGAGAMQHSDDLPLHLGTADAGEAWDTWVSQWSRVLTDYQDEVWGDLSALVDEARHEIKKMEDVKPGQKPVEPAALLRLRAILGHLRSV
ncbi:hypothetical protein QBC42DRAFT_274644 [Cladorrhinum samala]|uniref:Uncharacterized protein n=1 Tax=Cladorrhinum samala TaxID=585594 RepID=A0AAV9HFU1_9PEZI|nr:hypothetical protein QBC42DRAFT_274644 [Cladorrhinum samala]